MTAQFPTVSKKELGYNQAEVDELIQKARAAFAASADAPDSQNFVRNAQFSLVKAGYQIAAVDAALERLDDAFGAQLAKGQILHNGNSAVSENADRIRVLLKGRIARAKSKHFKTVPFFAKGYNKKQVDAWLAIVDGKLAVSGALVAADLRNLKFRVSFAGYQEAQVDAFIDRLIELSQLESALTNSLA